VVYAWNGAFVEQPTGYASCAFPRPGIVKAQARWLNLIEEGIARLGLSYVESD